MLTEQNKVLLRRFYEQLFNQGNINAIAEFVSPDLIEHAQLPPGTPPGYERVKHFFTLFRRAFPDLEATIEDLVVAGDKGVCRATWRATHQGEFIGIAPTGRQVTFEVIDIVRIAEGKIVEHWGQTDNLGLLQQLGVIPAPEQ